MNKDNTALLGALEELLKGDSALLERLVERLKTDGLVLPKLTFGEEVYGILYGDDKKDLFKGVVVGITYMKTTPKGPCEIWYTINLDEGVQIISEDQVYTSEEEVRKKLLGR